MGPGTLEAKLVPLSLVEFINNIYVLRKKKGPDITKVKYLELPKICEIKIFEIIYSPILLAYYAYRYKCNLIISYHIIPYAFYANFAFFITGIDYIVAQTGLLIQSNYKSYRNRILLKRIFHKAKFLLVPGSQSQRFWIQQGIPEDKVLVLHSTIDTKIFRPIEIEKVYDFIYLGRLAWEKNIHFVIKNLSQLKKQGYSFKMVIVGTGNLEKALKNLVDYEHLSEEIVFVGFQTEVTHWLNQARVLLMSSLSEGLPTGLMQAMACGLVCVSSNVGNIGDLLNEKTGFIYESGDNERFKEILKKILKNTLNNNLIGKNARKHIITNHSHTRSKEKWSNLLRNFEK